MIFPDPSPLDLSEHGRAGADGPQRLDRRLFMTLVVLDCSEPGADVIAERLRNTLGRCHLSATLYADLHHPRGLGLVATSEDPEDFTGPLRTILGDLSLLPGTQIRSDFSLLGRTYSTGFETDLLDWLIERPKRLLADPNSRYAVFYPLRRRGSFEHLDAGEKIAILREHGAVGRRYGEQNLAHDIRLSCHGLDRHDNDFVIGLLGRELLPLSHVVQSMRQTQQTAEYVEKLGPFFVGRTLCHWPG
jgi:hypothetical protein